MGRPEPSLPQRRPVVLIADSCIIHKSHLAQARPIHIPKFEILFQPAYQPWANDIEKLWKELHDNIARKHRYRNTATHAKT